jgi:hypothetical protein
VDKHPRILADLTGEGSADIFAFGDAGVYSALSNSDGTLQSPGEAQAVGDLLVPATPATRS